MGPVEGVAGSSGKCGCLKGSIKKKVLCLNEFM